MAVTNAAKGKRDIEDGVRIHEKRNLVSRFVGKALAGEWI